VLKLAADENFNRDIVRGLLRRKPDLDIVRVQDAGLGSADDPDVLEWAAREGRVLFTHDVATMSRFAWERASAGKSMPGVFEVPSSIPVRQAIEDILLVASCSLDGEWEGQVRYLPLRLTDLSLGHRPGPARRQVLGADAAAPRSFAIPWNRATSDSAACGGASRVSSSAGVDAGAFGIVTRACTAPRYLSSRRGPRGGFTSATTRTDRGDVPRTTHALQG
jgi:hypothetical protein